MTMSHDKNNNQRVIEGASGCGATPPLAVAQPCNHAILERRQRQQQQHDLAESCKNNNNNLLTTQMAAVVAAVARTALTHEQRQHCVLVPQQANSLANPVSRIDCQLNFMN